MDGEKVLKSDKGITLITLMITVAVIIILLGATIGTQDKKVIQDTINVKNNSKDKISQSQDKINNLVNELEDITESE